MNTPIGPGSKFRILFDMTDLDPEGAERVTPAGAVGTVEKAGTAGLWSVTFENGAAGFFSNWEILESGQCEVTA